MHDVKCCSEFRKHIANDAFQKTKQNARNGEISLETKENSTGLLWNINPPNWQQTLDNFVTDEEKSGDNGTVVLHKDVRNIM